MIKEILPPIIYNLIMQTWFIFKKISGYKKDQLFSGDDRLFKSIVTSPKYHNKSYLEFGVGASSIFVLNNTSLNVVACDSSQSWINYVKEQSNNKHAKFIWLDIGKLGNYGRPIDYSKRNLFYNYWTLPWQQKDFSPSIVLIDGRFRVACFIKTYLEADAGTKVFFDDYTHRPEYHVVEELITPTDVCGEQALFQVPEEKDTNLANRILAEFTNVLE